MRESFSLHNATKARLPRLAFARIKNTVLGKRYVLSLAVVGNATSRRLNVMYRKKNYVPNVLSFPLSHSEGEIVLNPQKANREASRFGMTARVYLLFLFIHACLHLKGHRHGVTMENIERRLLRRFSLKYS